MMLHSHDTCISGMEKLRIAMAKEVEKSNRKAVRNVLDLHELLTLCAQAVATNDRRRAHELLKQIKQHASETWDDTQRLGQCFAKGLEARLVGTGSQLSQLLIMEDRLSIVDFKWISSRPTNSTWHLQPVASTMCCSFFQNDHHAGHCG